MEVLKTLATFGVIEITIATALGIIFQQYVSSIARHIMFPLLKNFIDLNEIKLGNVQIGKFFKDTLMFVFSISVAFYILNRYVDYAVKPDEKEVKEKAKKQILEELGINKKRLMYAMV